MIPGPPELPVGVGQGNQIPPEPPSKSSFSRRLSLIAFCLTLLFLVLFVVLSFFVLRSLGMWQFGGRAASSAETLAMLAVICLLIAMTSNAVAFVASLWGWWKGRGRSAFILCVSGSGVLVSIAWLIAASN